MLKRNLFLFGHVAIIYFFLSSNKRHIAVVVAKLYERFQDNHSPDKKKPNKQVSSNETALNMSENLSKTLEQILEKLQKLDKIKSSLENIETKLQNLELRTERLKQYETAVKQGLKGLKDLKEELEKVNTQHKENMKLYEDTRLQQT